MWCRLDESDRCLFVQERFSLEAHCDNPTRSFSPASNLVSEPLFPVRVWRQIKSQHRSSIGAIVLSLRSNIPSGSGLGWQSTFAARLHPRSYGITSAAGWSSCWSQNSITYRDSVLEYRSARYLVWFHVLLVVKTTQPLSPPVKSDWSWRDGSCLFVLAGMG